MLHLTISRLREACNGRQLAPRAELISRLNAPTDITRQEPSQDKVFATLSLPDKLRTAPRPCFGPRLTEAEKEAVTFITVSV